MTPKYTNRQVAEDFNLWGEYFDTSGHYSRREFDVMSVENRERMIEEACGTDREQCEDCKWYYPCDLHGHPEDCRCEDCESRKTDAVMDQEKQPQ
jgi:hypothetical protein